MAENTTVIRDVTNTIKQLLRDNIVELTDENSITFDSPAIIESATVPKISLFLYQIVENSAMRNDPSEAIGETSLKVAPLRVDLLYLVTPYAASRETEFILLEKILQVFYDHAVMNESNFEGNLATQGNHVLRITPMNHPVEDLNKLWERFPGKPYKTSLAYMVSPVRIPSARTIDFTRVKTRRVDVSDIKNK